MTRSTMTGYKKYVDQKTILFSRDWIEGELTSMLIWLFCEMPLCCKDISRMFWLLWSWRRFSNSSIHKSLSKELELLSVKSSPSIPKSTEVILRLKVLVIRSLLNFLYFKSHKIWLHLLLKRITNYVFSSWWNTTVLVLSHIHLICKTAVVAR